MIRLGKCIRLTARESRCLEKLMPNIRWQKVRTVVTYNDALNSACRDAEGVDSAEHRLWRALLDDIKVVE